jgi:hypothetical protein
MHLRGAGCLKQEITYVCNLLQAVAKYSQNKESIKSKYFSTKQIKEGDYFSHPYFLAL